MPRDVISSTLLRLRKRFGNDAADTLGSTEAWSRITDGISTQSLTIDFAIGRPGIPLGRITEIDGLEASGKSTLSTHIMVEAQRRGGVAILVDSEEAYDVERSRRLGLDVDQVLLLQPPNLEKGLDMLEEGMLGLVAQKAYPIVAVVDTLAGLPSEAEESSAYGDSQVGVHARVMSRAFRKLPQLVAQHHIGLVFVNQLKEVIGGGWKPHGQKQYSSIGGHALRYHASLRLEVRQKEIVREGKGEHEVAVGVWVGIKVVKNKIAAPFRETVCYVDFERGYSRGRDFLRAAIISGVVEKSVTGRLSVDGHGFAQSAWGKLVTESLGGVKKVEKRIMQAAIEKGLLRVWDAPSTT